MKKFLVMASVLMLASLAQAEIVRDGRSFAGFEYLGPVDGPDLQAYRFFNDRVLSADTLYTLRGQVYIEDGASITIPAGTVIQGQPAGTLVVKQGGQIFADGTVDNPVIFTSSAPAGLRATGARGGQGGG